MGKIIFVTGTDTGVGKTLLTALLLCHLRQTGVHALAMKPFCSGGTQDVDLLESLQAGELTRKEINPFYFTEAIAPLVAARTQRRRISLADVTKRVRRVAGKCECLLVEGSGGLLVPLGDGYTVADLIERLRCEVIVVARNKLGTINHTLLTVCCLESRGVRKPVVVLMDGPRKDRASLTNHATLGELLDPVALWRVSHFGPGASRADRVKSISKQLKKVLASILHSGIFAPVLLNEETVKNNVDSPRAGQ